MEIAFTKIWNKSDHGYSDEQETNPNGHILLLDSITNTDDINKFWDLSNKNFIKDNYNLINIVKRYYINEYTFAINYTFYLKIFQKKYRKWLKKRKALGSLKNILNREIFGRYFNNISR